MNEKEIEKYFGKLVRSKREEKKITQEHLAELVGISPTYLQEIERGTYTISWIIWLRICKVLDMDIKDAMKKL